MNNIYISIAILVFGFLNHSKAQTISGDTNNGNGTYKFSNQAVYKGEWKDGKRHGKGKITYPKGASESNLKRVDEPNNNDSLYTCICEFWSKKDGITDENKAWQGIYKQLFETPLGALDEASFTLRIGTTSGKFFYESCNYGELLSAMSMVGQIYNGQYKEAAQSSADLMIGRLAPMIGTYKTILDATAITIEAIKQNWENDLYDSKVFQNLDWRIHKMVVRQKVAGDPYIPSLWVHGNPELRKKMKAIEDKIFWAWYEDFARWDVQYNDNRSGFMARISSKYGKGKKELTDRDIFDEFMKISIADFKAEIILYFRQHIEEEVKKEASHLKKAIIHSVCGNLHDMLKIQKSKK